MEPDRTRLRAWVAGGTGLVGGHLLNQLCDEPGFATVLMLVRRQVVPACPKIHIREVDFDALGKASLDSSRVDHVFCCLGTTLKQAGSREAFRRVDYEYPIALARQGLAHGMRRLVLISAVGADPASRFFYNRIKGEVERDLRSLAIPELVILRPSLLLGSRRQWRPGERAAGIALRPFSGAMRGPLRKYRPIEAARVGQAAIRAALTEHPVGNPWVLEGADLERAACCMF